MDFAGFGLGWEAQLLWSCSRMEFVYARLERHSRQPRRQLLKASGALADAAALGERWSRLLAGKLRWRAP